MDVHLI